MRPRVEVADGAMLGDGTVGTAKLHPDRRQAARNGSVPEGAILVAPAVVLKKLLGPSIRLGQVRLRILRILGNPVLIYINIIYMVGFFLSLRPSVGPSLGSIYLFIPLHCFIPCNHKIMSPPSQPPRV
ncbi:hypothetical protein VPH35_140255 [Triticum aestivum]